MWGKVMVFDKEPNLKEFNDIFQSYVSDCMSNDGNIQSHTFPANLNVWCEEEDGSCYDIVAINRDYLGGCGCPSGIEIIIKKSNI
jgi:hypothetical protein